MPLKSCFTPRFILTLPRSATTLARHGRQPVRRNAATTQQHCPQPVRRNVSSFLQLHNLPPLSAYVHLPFCRKRCHYCDFPIIALGTSDTTNPLISNYVHTICREIKAAKSNSSPNFPPLETIFFGGGTPSLIPPHHVAYILDALSAKFGISSDAEISMEMDPGTFDMGSMRELITLGVNRVSLGVQAFQEELLNACGRAHGVEEIYKAVEIVNSCGVENWSLDLISSLPHQSPTMWEESLRLSIEAQPTHVSVYDLQVEQNTKFGVLYTPGEFPLPSENQSAEFYKMASRMLTSAGYDHYEISSYCKSGYRCKHNTMYWSSKPFYAFGLGSASYINGVRFSRPRRLKEYTDYVQNLEDGPANYTQDGTIDPKDLAMDIVMLSLRTSDGLNLKAFEEAFGESVVESVCEAYRPHAESGYVVLLDEQRRVVAAADEAAFLRLSDPDGFLLSNELISVAFHAVGS